MTIFKDGIAVPDPKDYGSMALWYNQWKNPPWLDIDAVTVGQVWREWAHVEPTDGNFDFSSMRQAMEHLYSKGKKYTVQINGGKHPAWLFDVVPYIPAKVQGNHAQDRTLVYWDSRYVMRQRRLVMEFHKYLRELPEHLREHIIGIRQSYNAVGTEAGTIPSEWRSPLSWKGVSADGCPTWTSEIGRQYKESVVELYLDELERTKVPLFIRSNSLQGGGLYRGVMKQRVHRMLKAGQIGIFVTSTRHEPKNKWNADKYQPYLDWCKYTFALGENWPIGTDGAYGLTREQILYWRCVCDLMLGITFSGHRGTDSLDLGHYAKSPNDRGSIDFVNKYIGGIQDPANANGAFVAFRRTDADFHWGARDDYNFLAKRVSPKADTRELDRAKSKQGLGPDSQKQGAWARVVPSGKVLRIELDPVFVQSLDFDIRNAKIRVHALNDGSRYRLGIGEFQRDVHLPDNGLWDITGFDVPARALKQGIEITADDDTTLHMVEVDVSHLRGDLVPPTGGGDDDPVLPPDDDDDPVLPPDDDDELRCWSLTISADAVLEDGELRIENVRVAADPK